MFRKSMKILKEEIKNVKETLGKIKNTNKDGKDKGMASLRKMKN